MKLSRMYETYGKDWNYIQSLDPLRVGTLAQCGDGDKEILLAGVHYVNRFGYYILDTPWEEEWVKDADSSEIETSDSQLE